MEEEEVVSNEGWICINERCKESDINNLIAPTLDYVGNKSYEPGREIVCSSCGAVQHNLSFDHYLALQSRTVATFALFQNSYDRCVHFTERLSMFNCCDPTPDHEELAIIKRYHQILCNEDFFYKGAVKDKTMGRAEIKKLLRLVDEREFSLKLTKTKHYYARKYLESWVHLIDLLTGITFPKFSPLITQEIRKLLFLFSKIWNEWQPPEDKKTRETWKYKHRKHFPNVNFMFRKMFKVLEMDDTFDKYFPIPTTPSALNNLERYYNDLCEEIVYNKKWLTAEQLKWEDPKKKDKYKFQPLKVNVEKGGTRGKSEKPEVHEVEKKKFKFKTLDGKVLEEEPVLKKRKTRQSKISIV